MLHDKHKLLKHVLYRFIAKSATNTQKITSRPVPLAQNSGYKIKLSYKHDLSSTPKVCPKLLLMHLDYHKHLTVSSITHTSKVRTARHDRKVLILFITINNIKQQRDKQVLSIALNYRQNVS